MEDKSKICITIDKVDAHKIMDYLEFCMRFVNADTKQLVYLWDIIASEFYGKPMHMVLTFNEKDK